MARKHKHLYFEEIGTKFDEWMSDYDVGRRTEAILSAIPLGFTGATLEVGCGTGAITRGIAPLLDDLTVSDISEALSRTTSEKYGCKWTAEDATQLSFEDCTFDLVVSSECIEHTPNPKKCISEMLRVLKPEGILILTTPNRLWWPVVRLSQILKIRRFQGNEYFLSPRQVSAEVAGHDGEIIFKTGCHLFPWHFTPLQPLLKRIDKLGKILYPLMINQVVVARRLSS